MAIPFTRAKIISRAAGQSVVACAAYRAGEKLKDRTAEKTFDYRKKKGLIDEGITVPKDAPEWMKDRGELWNRIEEQENRKDAQLAREFIVAVPHELGTDGYMAIREIARGLAARGMVVDWTIHQPSKEGDQRNIHAHLITTMREIKNEGFGNKRREWNERKYLDGIKADIAESFNKRLRSMGLAEIDPRSYEQQGIKERKPGKHLGVEKTAIRRKEEREFQRMVDAEVSKILASGPEISEAMKDDPEFKRIAVGNYLSGLSAAEYATFASRMNEVLRNPKSTAEQREYQRLYLELTKTIHPAVLQDSREQDARRAREREQNRDRGNPGNSGRA